MADMQKLKKAEEEASKQVDAARKNRAQTLRQARAEAEAEIKQYRDSQMKKLDEMKSSHTGDNDKLTGLAQKAEQDTATLKSDVATNKSAVIARLVEVVTSVDLTVPEARKGIKVK